MFELGPVERRLLKEISLGGAIVLALIDSENLSPRKASNLARTTEDCGVAAILVGGSTATDQMELDVVVRSIKRNITKPVILFPGNITGVSPGADAILFSSLMNSDNPYFITEAQALGALSVKKHGLEAIPVGYIIVGDGGVTGFIGRARGIPPSKPILAAMYALAAQYMGMRFVYLEAGSGVTSHISSSMVSTVKKVYQGTLMVGGGIRSPDDALEVAKAGADIVVVGTLLEEKHSEKTLREIVKVVTRKHHTT